MDKFTKPIIVVWIDPETEKKRLMRRDKSNEENARNRINDQMTLDLKMNKADMVTDNTGSLDHLNEQFQKVLIEVSKPLTWTQFSLSKNGASVILASLTSGVVLCIKALL
ncbi:dephospho-CoA kinase-like [Arachis duranensis]|uniref:Dephospho-CoA kinase-like n=1 Tax=Arachis duranensis TaxID=130453 RepID=A0A6P5MCX8_ARADU|nr:dephospho-CoA kinase-like [Arachis duranensis]XP_025607686.1 dephospho-CoA kinase-like [Arachis hypogaea]QHO27316.1 Dephospho-CoA kinase [Arachis hypogaea]